MWNEREEDMKRGIKKTNENNGVKTILNEK